MNVSSLPAFVFAVMVLWWSPTIACFLLLANIFQLYGLRNDQFAWSRVLVNFFRVKVLKHGNNQPQQSRCLYLSNHRSWTDFFLDAYILEGRAIFLSRMVVGYAFPNIALTGLIHKSFMLFNKAALQRGGSNDKEVFNKWLDSQMDASPLTGLLTYPEGRRNTTAQSLPLNRGMLRYAYSRQMPVQAVISTNKDKVLNEQTLTVCFGTTVATAYSDTIRPSDYTDFEQFFNQVAATWHETWANVHAADPAGLPELQPTVAMYDYSLKMRLVQMVKEVVFFVLLLCTMQVWVAAVVLACCIKYGVQFVQQQRCRSSRKYEVRDDDDGVDVRAKISAVGSGVAGKSD